MDPIQNDKSNTNQTDNASVDNQVNPISNLPADDAVVPAPQVNPAPNDQLPVESPAGDAADITVSAPISDNTPAPAPTTESTIQSPQTDTQENTDTGGTSADANQSMGSF